MFQHWEPDIVRIRILSGVASRPFWNLTRTQIVNSNKANKLRCLEIDGHRSSPGPLTTATLASLLHHSRGPPPRKAPGQLLCPSTAAFIPIEMASTVPRGPVWAAAHAAESPLPRLQPPSPPRPGFWPSRPTRHLVRASSRTAEAPARPVPGYELVRLDRPLAASGPLSADQIESFYQDGYVVVRGLVSGELLDRAREAAAALEDRKIDASRPTFYSGFGWYLWEKAPVFRELAVSSAMTAAAAQLTP
ncbi:unnamed protein product [Ostreobium quekettii]|uniref:Phytanoyl-CoA dioxygenase n=1 Tax=Ostreobium quekettii TaxID=121088 RepID=A0A8S1IZA5_9CHLO|nr:unnamed protein product [Ostreobium quekettii]